MLMLVVSSETTYAIELAPEKPNYSCLDRASVDKINTCFDDLKDCHESLKNGGGSDMSTVVIVAVGAIIGGYLLGKAAQGAQPSAFSRPTLGLRLSLH